MLKISGLLRARKLLRQGITPYCSVVIAAAGSSQRMGGDDKIFIPIHGVPVLAHTILAFQSCKQINEIVVVAREDNLERVADICKKYGISKASNVMTGGANRLESVINGINAVSKKAKLIAIHDGARPCVETDLIKNTIKAATLHHAAAPCVPVSSTLKSVKGDLITATVDRSDTYEVQTPQVFDADVIKAALHNARKKSIEITDDCKALEIIGFPVRAVAGSSANIKLTTKEDIKIAKAILRGVWEQGVGSRE